ncbi:MAG: hypothetical protein IJI43_03170 [Bacilli bacterium]|nr:hypothetical protein [Bacilli bacterium]
MEELYSMGIRDEILKSMIETNPEITELSDSDIRDKENILLNMGCSNKQVLSIIGSNPTFLSRTDERINKLIDYLGSMGFDTLNILFDSNPYILNLEAFEIDNYINNRKNNGEELDNIIDDLDSNPYLFYEM